MRPVRDLTSHDVSVFPFPVLVTSLHFHPPLSFDLNQFPPGRRIAFKSLNSRLLVFFRVPTQRAALKFIPVVVRSGRRKFDSPHIASKNPR